MNATYSACEEKLSALIEEHEDLKMKYSRLKEDVENIKREKDTLIQEHLALRKDYSELSERYSESETRRHISYELFKSFVDDDSQKVMLLDASYAIRYINRSAREWMHISDEQERIGQRLFDFMEYTDALKLKEKIDKAFLNDSEEKVKKLHIRLGENGSPVKAKMKVSRVRYRDKPSVKILFS